MIALGSFYRIFYYQVINCSAMTGLFKFYYLVVDEFLYYRTCLLVVDLSMGRAMTRTSTEGVKCIRINHLLHSLHVRYREIFHLPLALSWG